MGVAEVADTPLVIVTVATSHDMDFLAKAGIASIRHGGSRMKLTTQKLTAMFKAVAATCTGNRRLVSFLHGRVCAECT